MTKPATQWKTHANLKDSEAQERRQYGGLTLAEVVEVRETPELWARSFGKIQDRVTKLPIDFTPSVLQKRMFSWYAICQRKEVPCRMVVVKIRRGGGSTGAAAIMHLHAHNYTARLGAVGTDETVSMNMFAVMRFFDKHDLFPDPGWKKASKVLETGSIQWPNGSSWEKYTAENPEAARSAGLQGYHATEVGRWHNGGAKDAKETLRSMLGAVPRRGFTVAIEESTAQGAQGAFWERWQGGRWPTHMELGCAEGREYWRIWEQDSPQNVAESEAERALQFVRTFSAWYEDDENRAEGGVNAEDRLRIETTLDAKEQELIRRYRTIGPQGERLGRTAVKATLWEQLAWRRAVIATEFDGDVEGFEQENPSSPKEAFASSGRHSFNQAGCAWMKETAKTRVPEIGVLEQQPDGVVFRRTAVGEAWVEVWEPPREGHRYLFALDTMGGVSNVRNEGVADYNAGCIMRAPFVDDHGRKWPATEVCSLFSKCQWDPDMLAEKVKAIADWYGGGQVVFEVNNTGAAFRQEAMRLGLNLYREEVFDRVSGVKQTDIVGWTTNKETRAQLIGTLKKHIRNNANADTRGDGVLTWNPATAAECGAMILHPNGKDAAPGGAHDDRVMMLGMGLQCIGSATYLAAKVRRHREPADRKLWKKYR